MKRNLSTMLWVGILLLTGFFIAGSGGNVVPAQAQTTVKIGVGPTPSLLFLPLYVAEAKGYFSDLSSEGFQIEIVPFGGGAETATALFAGNLDFGNLAIDHSIRAVSRGESGAIMLTTFLESLGLALVVNKDLAGSVDDVADLKGKTIGMTASGSGSHLLGIRLVRLAGLNESDVTFVAVGSTEPAIAALENKTVDAVIHSDPAVTTLIEAGHKLLVDVRTPEETKRIYGDLRTFTGLQATGEFITFNPDIVSAVIKAYAKAMLWIEYHSPDEISQLLSNEGVADFSASVIEANLPGESVSGLTRQEGVDTAIQALIEDGLLPAGFDEPAGRFYDNSYLTKAVEEILGE